MSAYPFRSHDWASLISVKAKNPYAISGYIVIQYTEKATSKVTKQQQQLTSVVDASDMLYQLNNGALASYAKFEFTDKTNTQLKLNLLPLATQPINNPGTYSIQIYGTGNMGCLLGLLPNKLYIPTANGSNFDPILLSPENGFRIQYLQLKTPSIAGSLQKTSAFQMEGDTIAVLSQSDDFIYLNKNLDTQAEITNVPIEFSLVDQDNRPVQILYYYVEIQLIQEAYFRQGHLSEKHEKKQLFIQVPENQVGQLTNYFNVNFGRKISQYSVVGVYGQIKGLQLTEQNSVFTLNGTQSTFYQQQEFIGYQNRLLNYDVFNALSAMITRMSGSTCNMVYIPGASSGNLAINYHGQVFSVASTNILYGVLQGNPNFSLQNTDASFILNATNLFRYTTMYDIKPDDDENAIRVISTNLVLKPQNQMVWTWNYLNSQRETMGFEIKEYIENAYGTLQQVNYQHPSNFILRLFVK